jgi:hypothetical protein
MTRQLLSLALLFSVCLVGAARADLVPLPPDVSACLSLTVGSPCTNNGPGTCQNATCTDSPGASGYSCLKCVPNGSGKDSGSDQSKDSSGCTIGGRLARAVGPWLAAGLFGAATLLTRRRPRR